jgi:hypothetical protein
VKLGRISAVAAAALLVFATPAHSAPPPAAQCASVYDPSNQPPFGGQALPPAEPLARGGARAVAIADATDVVHAQRAETPDMVARTYTRGPCFWEVRYFDGPGEGATQVAQVLISAAEGSVVEAWRGHQVEVKLARGYPGAVGRVVNSPWIWIPLCVIFVAPFFDPRRPLRLLHLDLLAIVALSVSLAFFNHGNIDASVPLVYPVLGYLFARMLFLGLRGARGEGPLVPLVPIRVLAIAAIVLAAGRIAVNAADSNVIDIGLAGVVGADRIEHGQPLYEGDFTPPGIDLRGDVYGPADYLAYVPFEEVLPWSGEWDDVPAAHAAAIAFDLLTALMLFVAGRALRRERDGTALGVALAFAWLACPWTLYAMNAAANDALVALLVTAALAALAVPALRGGLLALATMVKFGPLALAPLFATGTGERRWRSAAIFALAFFLVAAAVTIPFLPDGGLREFYDRTFGYQASRGSPFSIWGLAPSLHPLEDAARVFAIALGILVAFVPARKTPAQVAALAAAVIIATQVGATHWFYFYVVWFLPLVLIAGFLAHSRVSRSASEASPASVS